MPQIANQDYNVIDFNELPYYEAVERLYRAYLQGTAFDCVAINRKSVEKIIVYKKDEEEGREYVSLGSIAGKWDYLIKAPLATDDSGNLWFKGDDQVYIISADGFKLKPIVKDGVLTGVEDTTETIASYESAQYFKDWMIGQPVEGGGEVTPK